MSVLNNLMKKLPRLGYFNEIPAGMIDKIYRDKATSFVGKAFQFIQKRVIFALGFVPLSLIDMVVSSFIASIYSFRAFFTTEDTQEARLEQMKIYASNFSKNLYALLASPFGFISPKLVSLYFVPDAKQTGVSAGGDYHHARNAVLESPETIEDLQALVKNAAREGKKIMPIGAGFSQGKQFLPEGDENLIVVDLSKFNTVEIHSKEKQAIVGAGAIWSDIKQEANKFKLALKVMQASDVFSVGGSLGTNIHGWNIHDGMLSTVVTSITIINAEGELETLTPEDQKFHNVTGGLGLYGIIVSATINLTDNELLKEKGVAIEPEQYVQHFRENVITDPNTRMHLYRLSLDPNNLLGTGVAVSYVKEDDSKPVQDNLRPEAEHGTRLDRIMINMARHSPWARQKYWNMESARLLANDGEAMSVNKIMQPPINAMFNSSKSETEWLQEFFLPEENLADFLKELGALLQENDVALLNASVRFVKQNDRSPMSYAHDGDRFAVVLCFNQSLEEKAIIKARKWIRQAQHLTVEKGGSYYLPYQHISNPEDFHAAYPHVDEALIAKDEADPDHLFVSGFYQRFMEPKPETTNHFKVIMANEATKAKFAGFLKNVLHRLDSDKFFALLEDILQYNDSHEEIYQELARRLPEIAPGTLGDLLRILDSLSAIKTDLGEQAHSLLPQEMKTIDGLVEIGYPGRFVNGFKQHYKITGEVVAVYEQQSITDYIQTGFPRPYDRFEQLDYSNPNLAKLKDNSADVITCYVGLHHFGDEELEHFLEEVKRVLRPNGRFLLVDHDVTDEETMSMAHMAHTVFNIATGVSLQEEMTETRKFHSMTYWRQKLQEHGLGYTVDGPDVPLVRNGDPSRNRMVSFAKPGPMNQLNPVIVTEPANDAEVERRQTQVMVPDYRNPSTHSNAQTMRREGVFKANDTEPSSKVVNESTMTLV
ncbi:FAD-binding protein [Legionella saoudiensis]|uniref:FAD-binding protein n=1 Tax=Legionella saoudiensis TaxID=1750561 RepID=UPI00072FBC3C|nr:FAD-binding protein [Legionella saoudiensis]